MKKSVLIRAALLCLLAVPAAGQVPAGPQEKMPLDGEVRVGRLDNGMTYYIRHYDNPRQRADFFIAHDVGALQEEDDQNGLAHFLEHMAFNGTKHFPGKGILNYLAANGVRFGYNVNAYTSRDRTVYNVSNVPLVREGLVDSLLLILHDWSYYIACEPGEIESERGVIREEWRRGNDARSRMARKSAEVEYDGSKYARRDVIGDISGRRGSVRSLEARNGAHQIDCDVPLSEMFGYATNLRSRTQGRGQFSMEPSHYVELSKNLADEVIKKRRGY
jgi:zinc protease